MYTYKPENGVPIYSWIPKEQYELGDSIDRFTMKDQMEHLAQLPFIFHHGAIMRDGHVGFGMPIGGVFASKGYIVPYAVGKDVGCGMIYIQTNILVSSFINATTKDGQNLIWAMLSNIKRNIPVGFNHNKEPQEEWCITEVDGVKVTDDYTLNQTTIVKQEYIDSLFQLGTLGGGNHFIDLMEDQNGMLAIMIHSGSRNLGSKVCDYYNNIAKNLNEKYHSKVPKEWQLAFLPVDSDEGQMYIREMNLCLSFAYANRYLMMQKVKNIVLNMLEKYAGIKGVAIINEINIHHNYAALENHFGENVWVHRKGATKASRGLPGIIPGSMGTNAYIIEGLGNKESFESCSHGAGRTMGRKAAMAKYTAQEVIEHMKKLGVQVMKVNMKDIPEECPWSYKNIDDVINDQSDLVKVTNILKPIGVLIA